MPSDYNIIVNKVNLLNDTNEISVAVLLESLWDSITKFDYLYVNVSLNIPILSQPANSNLLLDLHQEFAISSIDTATMQVTLLANFGGVLDSQREVIGTSNILCYNKSISATLNGGT